MSTTLGLDRVPPPIAALLGEAAVNLVSAANTLDTLPLARERALETIKTRQSDVQRIHQDLLRRIPSSRRAGPDRLRPLLLVEAAGALVDALERLASTWLGCALPQMTDVVFALRDCARENARGLAAHENPVAIMDHVASADEREQEVRWMLRRARLALLVENADPRVGLCGQRLLGEADRALAACGGLRGLLQRQALA